MFRPLAIAAACLAAAHAGDTPASTSPPRPNKTTAPTQKRLPAVSLLPNDSRLQQVMIPRYDAQRRLLAVLRAGQMKIIDAENVTGETVRIELHRPEGGLRGIIDLRQAHFDQKSGLLRGRENVAIRSDTMRANGSGVVYELERSRGFLLGPADTLFYKRPTATSMNQPARLHRLSTLLASSLPLLPISLPAGPAALSDDELARISRDLSPAAVDAAGKARAIDADQAAAAVQSAKAETELAAFLRDAALTSLLAETKAPVPPTTPPAAEDLDPGPGATRVLCDGGMFFDTAQGILVYLKNIRLSDPRFDLTCTDELKVFLAKKPAPAPKKPAPKEGTSTPPEPKPEEPKVTPPAKPDSAKPANPAGNLLGGDFGDIDRLVASGSVRVVRKDPQGQPVIATADSATYEAVSGDVILRGGFPTVRKGKDFLRALEPGLYIRLYANGDVYAQPGKWETGVANLNDKQKPGAPR